MICTRFFYIFKISAIMWFLDMYFPQHSTHFENYPLNKSRQHTCTVAEGSCLFSKKTMDQDTSQILSIKNNE